MREQLIQYVELLFAAAPDSGEIKQEILQNTLDRYDDLVSQGKQPEAAYRLAITGIGDINEILGSAGLREDAPAAPKPDPAQRSKPEYRAVPAWKKVLRAVGVFLYIISPIPLFILGEMSGLETVGLCGTLAIVAVATALMVIAGGNGSEAREKAEHRELTPRQELRKAVKTGITVSGLVVYFAISFLTHAWYITWLVFPIMAAVQGLVTACMDLKEAGKYEN